MFSPLETGDLPPPWRERALDRSLGDQRARQEHRLERFVDAARSLANSSGSADFTVQQVVSEAGLSLKSFYACFGSKDELLCALVEEDSRIGAQLLAEVLERCPDPVARVRTYVHELMAFGTRDDARGYVAVLLREHRRLAQQRPAELRHAIAPLVMLLTDALRAADEQGALAPRDPARDAATIFGLVLDRVAEAVFSPEIATASEQAAEFVWRFCLDGLTPGTETTVPRSTISDATQES